jgi:DNA-binding transcriptional LysR family regulator
MEITSRQLRAFHLVAKHRNFTRAAEALFITPSGLSVLIRELERQVGFRLFDRTTRLVALTAQGNELLDITLPALNALEEGILKIEGDVKKKNRRISIGATPWFAAHVLPGAIKEFRERRPAVEIHPFDGSLASNLKMVEDNKLDYALGIFDRIIGIRRVPIFKFSLVLVEPEEGRGPRSGAAKWSSLSGKNLISLTKDYPYEELIDQQLAKLKINCKRDYTVNLLDSQIGLVEAGLGVAVIPSFGVLAARNRSVRFTNLEPAVTFEVHEISKRGRTLPSEAAEFSAFLKTYVSRKIGQ